MARNERSIIEGISISHPSRLVYPAAGITKADLAAYYSRIAKHMLPELCNRPLSLVRCPDGYSRSCFFQKHPGQSLARGLTRITLNESNGTAQYLVAKDADDLVQLCQMNVLELHCWGSRASAVEAPDRMVFDLDPAPDLPVRKVIDCAQLLRRFLREVHLPGYVKTTGGKGLHVVVPLSGQNSWDEVKRFARAIAVAMVDEQPKSFVMVATKSRRPGRIFIDYLRNGRGATSIANYSPRARAGAPVATPLYWRELRAEMSFSHYTVKNIFKRVHGRFRDPWRAIEDDAAALPMHFI